MGYYGHECMGPRWKELMNAASFFIVPMLQECCRNISSKAEEVVMNWTGGTIIKLSFVADGDNGMGLIGVGSRKISNCQKFFCFYNTLAFSSLMMNLIGLCRYRLVNFNGAKRKQEITKRRNVKPAAKIKVSNFNSHSINGIAPSTKFPVLLKSCRNLFEFYF